MPKLVIIAGKNDVIDWALDTYKKLLPRFSYFRFDKKIDSYSSLDDVINFRDRLENDISKVVRTSIKRDMHVIVCLNPIIYTDMGYVPILTERFFKQHKPDVILIANNDELINKWVYGKDCLIGYIKIKGRAQKGIKELIEMLKKILI